MFEIDDAGHDLVQDELFGPIVSLERFSSEEEALSKANATRYGLAASVYTTDLNRSMRMGRKLQFGTVWMNCHNRLLAEVETGGYRESGIGRLHGIEAMNDFLETKHIYLETDG
jgi:acyl-CoA reductase-like NAD-dependent aldehyde dehydrogenase